jgi:signal transduction histidine kinase
VGVGDEIVGRFGNLADQVGHDPTFVTRYRELTTEKGIKIGLHVVVRDLDPNDHIKVTYYMALAVKNIIANAHKYCYRDGWGFISMKMDFSTRGLTVIIHNNGDGIPQCVVEGLFKGALQSQSGGLGIGMHRVYEGLRKVGGDIILSRNVRNPTDKNHGVTFEMKVPITKIAQ